MVSKELYISSPGKIILHGEHAVVYGKKAVACSLNVRTFCQMKESDNSSVVVDLPDIQVKRQWPVKEIENLLILPLCNPRVPEPASVELVHKLKLFTGLADDTTDTKLLALVAFIYLYSAISYNESLPSMELTISSNLPTGAGLGSSAAYSTSLAAGLLLHRKLIKEPCHSDEVSTGSWSSSDLHLINFWAFQAEKIIHGNPSGIDNSVSTFGGALIFQKGTITPIDSVPPLRISLINTKVPRSTKALVAGVKEKYTKYPKILAPILDSMEAICEKCIDTFAAMVKENAELRNNYKTLQDLIDMNQKLLEILGVSHQVLKTVCEVAAKSSLSAKLTGAGGGGCAFVLISPDTLQDTIHSMEEEIRTLGYDVWETSICGQGVLRHFSLDDPQFNIPQSFRS